MNASDSRGVGSVKTGKQRRWPARFAFLEADAVRFFPAEGRGAPSRPRCGRGACAGSFGERFASGGRGWRPRGWTMTDQARRRHRFEPEQDAPATVCGWKPQPRRMGSVCGVSASTRRSPRAGGGLPDRECRPSAPAFRGANRWSNFRNSSDGTSGAHSSSAPPRVTLMP